MTAMNGQRRRRIRGRRGRRRGSTLAAALVLLPLLVVPASGFRASMLSPSDNEPEDRAVITIRSRVFDPATISLRAGRKTRLVIHNTDAELHAFVPVGLLAGLHFHVLGNGAPQFDTQGEGLKRIIIPSHGTAELRFVPERRGVFPYFCDMPGHDMAATIVVD